jgi:hypothetical protein
MKLANVTTLGEGLPITSDLRFVHITPAPILARLE